MEVSPRLTSGYPRTRSDYGPNRLPLRLALLIYETDSLAAVAAKTRRLSSLIRNSEPTYIRALSRDLKQMLPLMKSPVIPQPGFRTEFIQFAS